MIDTATQPTKIDCENFHKVESGDAAQRSTPVMLESSHALSFPFSLIAEQLQVVEESLRTQAKAFDPGVEGYVEYVCGTSGKRIRPALCLLARGACGGPMEDTVKLGVILELIHLATLVHDDIMDGASVRRGMPTAAVKWGSSLSVLLGDCLFARALELAASFDGTYVSRKIAQSANEVCSGEILQTQRRFDLSLSIDDYFKIIRMKTAALFASATELAGYLSGATEAVQESLRAYGDGLGTAYQIYDDLLDLVGEERTAGKTLGTDLVKGKLTLPILYLMESATEAQRTKLNKLILKHEPIDLSVLAGIADYAGAIERSVNTAKRILADARQSLIALPGGDFTTALEGITRYLDGLLEKCRAV